MSQEQAEKVLKKQKKSAEPAEAAQEGLSEAPTQAAQEGLSEAPTEADQEGQSEAPAEANQEGQSEAPAEANQGLEAQAKSGEAVQEKPAPCQAEAVVDPEGACKHAKPKAAAKVNAAGWKASQEKKAANIARARDIAAKMIDELPDCRPAGAANDHDFSWKALDQVSL